MAPAVAPDAIGPLLLACGPGDMARNWKGSYGRFVAGSCVPVRTRPPGAAITAILLLVDKTVAGVGAPAVGCLSPPVIHHHPAQQLDVAGRGRGGSQPKAARATSRSRWSCHPWPSGPWTSYSDVYGSTKLPWSEATPRGPNVVRWQNGGGAYCAFFLLRVIEQTLAPAAGAHKQQPSWTQTSHQRRRFHMDVVDGGAVLPSKAWWRACTGAVIDHLQMNKMN